MGNEELLCKLLEERRNKIKDSAADFDIFAVCHNLRMFALEKPEDSSWKEQKIYKKFDQFVLDNYTTKIKQLTENHLKELNGSCDVDIMQHYVVEELRKEPAFKSGKYNHIAMQNTGGSENNQLKIKKFFNILHQGVSLFIFAHKITFRICKK